MSHDIRAVSYNCPSCERVLYDRRLAHCAYCGTEIPDSFRLTSEEITLEAHSPEAGEEQSSREFLGVVRRGTCYSALRRVIDWFATLSIIVIVILMVCYVIAGFLTQSVLLVVSGVVIGVLGCFLVICSKQASQILIDIADTLIEQNRKKREKG